MLWKAGHVSKEADDGDSWVDSEGGVSFHSLTA